MSKPKYESFANNKNPSPKHTIESTQQCAQIKLA
jgi:hypothetical protein